MNTRLLGLLDNVMPVTTKLFSHSSRHLHAICDINNTGKTYLLHEPNNIIM